MIMRTLITNLRKTFFGLAVGAILLCLPYISTAQESMGSDMVVVKEVSGEIGGIMRSFISIIYEQDPFKHTEKELGLMLDSNDIKVVRRTLDQLKVRDTVKVQYEETSRDYLATNEDGSKEQKTKIVSRKAIAIQFIRSAKEADDIYDMEALRGSKKKIKSKAAEKRERLEQKSEE